MSNALKIARRLKLPNELIRRAHKYLRRRGGRNRELMQLQELREDAEKAKQSALEAELQAAKQRDEYERRLESLERETQETAELNQKRTSLQPNDRVRVTRFDKVGRVVRVNAAKQIVTVSVGLGQWEIPFDEIFPEDD